MSRVGSACFGVLVLVAVQSCGEDPKPVPGGSCTFGVPSVCHDSMNVIACERQTDGVYRWSAPDDCGSNGCTCKSEAELRAHIPPQFFEATIKPCNCWDF